VFLDEGAELAALVMNDSKARRAQPKLPGACRQGRRSCWSDDGGGAGNRKLVNLCS
jgi:hypothetical protein